MIAALNINKLFTILLIPLLLVSTGVKSETEFDHSLTGFILTGQHRHLACETCHIRGIFKGLPTTCKGCHENFSQIGGSLKPMQHVQTNAACDDCHSDSSWTNIRMDHSTITGDCISCHNNVQYPGKPGDHILSSDNCDDCHLTVAWLPARFDHFGITDPCASCHNNSPIIGKPVNHVPSSDVCDDCHTTTAWTPALFDHSTVTDSCVSCHVAGGYADGKPADHFVTSDVCDDCHIVSDWHVVQFDHASASTAGVCNTCHNNINATGMGGNHFVTSQQCDECHVTSGWDNVSAYSHSGANYPDHTGAHPDCIDCHAGNSEYVSTGTNYITGYYPECAACHASDYVQNKHENNPLVPVYINCAGTCHESTPKHHLYDNSFDP